MNLKWKSLFFITFVIMIPMLFFGYYAFSETRSGLAEMAKREMHTLLQSEMNDIRSRVEFYLREHPELHSMESILAALAEDALYDINLSEKSEVFLVNHSGTILIHSQKDRQLRHENVFTHAKPYMREVYKEIVTKPFGFVKYRDEGLTYYLSFIRYDEGVITVGSSMLEAKYTLPWTLAIYAPEKVLLSSADTIWRFFIIVLVISLVVTIAVGYILINNAVLRKINNIVNVMRKNSEESTYTPITLDSNDEFGFLARSFNRMITRLRDAQASIIQREILKEKLDLAANIQSCLLPTAPLANAYDLSASMLPADNIGGDYYDVFKSRDGKLWVGIGDVSGHGIIAGLIMMMTQTAVATTLFSEHTLLPSDLLQKVNQTLYYNIHSRLNNFQFITLSFLRLDDEGNVVYAGAHLDILVYRKRTATIERIKTRGIWLGIKENIASKTINEKFRLEEGDTVLLYTDGIIEARNSEGEWYEHERLANIFLANADKKAREIKAAIIHDVNTFIDEQKDDITVFVMKKV